MFIKLYTMEELSEKTGVSREQLQAWHDSELLKPVYIGKTKKKFTEIAFNQAVLTAQTGRKIDVSEAIEYMRVLKSHEYCS